MGITKVMGIMSGTSLDGVDIACCEFDQTEGNYLYKIVSAITVSYSDAWIFKLQHAPQISAFDLALLDKDYGHYLGQLVKNFADETGFYPDLIASHGHTLFHQPNRGLTYQLGNGAAIRASSGHTVVCDFRSLDVGLGGQGAPLVPIGDKLLFGKYTCCLNLGGFSNISFDENNRRIAHDISPCNMALNMIAEKAGVLFDNNGEMARRGEIIPGLLNQLNSLEFYTQPPPKSLGREWFESEFSPLIHQENYRIHDLLRTLTEHIALQIRLSISPFTSGTLLITGGGAHNTFLIERIQENVPLEVVLPDKQIIDFKEALVFAFLGLLRYEGKINVLASVTGSRENHSGGAVFL